MSVQVKAEIDAVRKLRAATVQYATQLRGVVEAARREIASAQADLRQGVDAHRGNASRAAQNAQRAREAFARCPVDQRDPLRAQLEAAEQSAVNANRLLERARGAEHAGAEASTELVRTLHQVLAAVSEHSSAASTALAELDTRLGELTALLGDRGGRSLGERAGRAAQAGVVTLGVAAEVAVGAMGVAKLAGNVSQGAIPTGDRITSSSEMTEWRVERDHDNYSEYELDRRKREVERHVAGEGDSE